MTLTEHRTQMIGFTLYAEGHDIEACANETERRGWWVAWRAQSACDDMDAWAGAGMKMSDYIGVDKNFQDGPTLEDYATAWQG